MSATEEQIVEALQMVRRMATRYRRTPLGAEDALGVGAVALVEAGRRFDPKHGVPFAGFAFTRVKWRHEGRLLRPLRSPGDPVRRRRCPSTWTCWERSPGTCVSARPDGHLDLVAAVGRLRCRLRTIVVMHACGVPHRRDSPGSRGHGVEGLAVAERRPAQAAHGGRDHLTGLSERRAAAAAASAVGPRGRWTRVATDDAAALSDGECDEDDREPEGGDRRHRPTPRRSAVRRRSRRARARREPGPPPGEGLRLLQPALRAKCGALAPREGRHPAPVAAVLARLVAGLEHRAALLARHFPDGARRAAPPPAAPRDRRAPCSTSMGCRSRGSCRTRCGQQTRPLWYERTRLAWEIGPHGLSVPVIRVVMMRTFRSGSPRDGASPRAASATARPAAGRCAAAGTRS